MDRMPESPTHDAMEVRIVAVAYGEASPVDRIRVVRAVRRDPALRRLLEEHRRVAASVRDLPRMQAPAALDDRIHSALDLSPPGPRLPGWRPLRAPAAMLAAACAIAIALWAVRPAPEPEAQYTQAEVETALRQIEAAFALVNHGMARAGATLNRDVLSPALSRPLQGSRTILHDLLQMENKS